MGDFNKSWFGGLMKKNSKQVAVEEMRRAHIHSFKKLGLEEGDANSRGFELKEVLFLKFFKYLNLNGKARVEESHLNIQD